MNRLRQAGWLSIAMLCWLLLSVSIGWYYTVTYFGRVGWPMPSVETVGALLLYYFSVLNVDTEIQAIHWVLVFPIAGFLWSLLLCEVARRSGQATNPERARLAAMIALASLPLRLLCHTGLTAVVFLLAVALSGTAASYPLRWWLE